MSAMENLWKKETPGRKSNYIDLFPRLFPARLDQLAQKLRSDNGEKNNTISTELRLEGNDLFRSNEFVKAMDFYSASLCFAEIGTENVALVYANRSSCFLSLKMYEKALIDIELAKQTNYPDRLLPKLEERRAKCLRLMETEIIEQSQFEPKLSFQPHDRFNCLANVLDIKYNDQFGRFVAATADIDVGKTIMVEQNFASVSIDDERMTCTNCMKINANFIACPHCIGVMYCNIECMQQDAIHELVCGQFQSIAGSIKLYIKTILIAIQLFESVDRLIEFVENAMKAGSNDVPETVIDTKSQYRLYLTLHSEFCTEDQNDLFVDAQKIYITLQSAPAIKNRFNTLRKQRFLQHLICQHLLVTARNRFQYTSDQLKVTDIAPMGCIFNHSCAPNVFNDVINDKAVFITIRPVRKGEQLFISYLGENASNSTDNRQMSLLEDFGFVCECDKCQPHCSHVDQAKMKCDSHFTYVEQSYKTAFEDKIQRIALKEACIEFLQKYGHLPWSDEINLVMLCYLKWLFEYMQTDF
ncbi:SET and MYND domain-containing protein 4-like [Contarinia nasturtii]|uniref:SET and MYND domain-containing protein 4-like n=1 Tax=Contarinia nasturtii TaxID=265458 RepID=UPI0012D3F2AC|nr:SET and MYND domain-containing protein 4-like [Contarinia nasturtii]